MKDLDEKAKLEDTLQSAPPPKFTKVSVHPSAGKAYVPRASNARRANSCFPSSLSLLLISLLTFLDVMRLGPTSLQTPLSWILLNMA